MTRPGRFDGVAPSGGEAFSPSAGVFPVRLWVADAQTNDLGVAILAGNLRLAKLDDFSDVDVERVARALWEVDGTTTPIPAWEKISPWQSAYFRLQARAAIEALLGPDGLDDGATPSATRSIRGEADA